jgi:REP element-mobilizing transposase RayT
MAQSLADIVLHIVFSTKERKPWIDAVNEPELHAYICGICRNLDCPVIKINGVEDHIHVLLSLSRTIAVSKLIAEIKSNSSRWIKMKDRQFCEFSWQGGYGGFSVSRPQINGAIKYIEKQKEHHKTQTFREEYLTMLKMAQIQYDEKYLWD